MYEQFFGLRERPFELTPNPRYLFMTSRHREALGNLIYGISARKGITVLTGEAGTGKTTMLSVALVQWRDAGHLVATIKNPTMDRHEFLQFLSHEFGLSAEAAASKTTLLQEFEALLRKRHAAGLLTALVIDEAHSLPTELLEEIRLLANIETPEAKLLPLILLGQPELADRLNDPSLRQLKQRVALRCSLTPLDLRETAAYVAKRIQLAGGESLNLFTREAIEAVHHGSGGIPRLINVICDNALVSAMAADHRPVGQDIVRDVCTDFDLPVLPRAEDTPEPVATRHTPTVGASRASVSRAPVEAAPMTTTAAPGPSTQPASGRPGHGGLLAGARILPIDAVAPGGVELDTAEEPSFLSRWLRWSLGLFKMRERT